ncbi:unnamed protein product [Malus baccata var. baccata]
MRLEAMDFLHFQKEYLDVVLVPSGLLIMLIYHLFLLYKYVNYPLSTAIGSENNDKKVWVGKILQLSAGEDVQVAKKVKTALDVISSNTTWMANSNNNNFPKQIIYGNTNPSTISIKYICILTFFSPCFFMLLFNQPGTWSTQSKSKKAEREVERGSEFWSLGLRALYFALNFLLWFFGPIPMFTSSVATVVILSCHDFKNSGGDQKCPASANARNERLLLVS